MLLASTNVFFNYLQNTFGESEKDRAAFQAASDACNSGWLRVWTIIQQVIKKQSLNAYHFLGLCGNLYMIIDLNRSNWMLRAGFDGHVGEGGRGD